MDYTITQNFINKNRSRVTINPVGMVVHETATPNATDEAEQKYFNNNDLKASVHAFLDYDSITQTLPWNEKCWGAGKTANNKFIQVELCHFDGDKFIEVWNRGVWLFAWVFVNILKINTVTKDNLMSHQEVSLKWKETDHTDPHGFFKDNGKTVDEFRSAVQNEINNMIIKEEMLEMFKDVEKCRWSAKSIERLVNLEILSGYSDNTFRPTQSLTREEFASVIDKVLKLLGK